MTGPQFCGYAVPGDRGGPAEACGKALPCEAHPSEPSVASLRAAVETLTTERNEARSALANNQLHDISRRLAEIAELVKSSDSYVPQDVAAECLLMIRPLDEMGKPNTLVALVERAMTRVANAEATISRALEWLRLSDENMSRASSLTQVDRAILTLGEYLEQKKLREGGTS